MSHRRPLRILVDYRPALRARTGVGEYIHELVRAYAAAYAGGAGVKDQRDHMAVLTSSWKDRPAAGTAAALGADVVDRRIPVAVLNLLWHRLEWPPIETLAGSWDVVHAAHPLLIPARHAAQVVTIHDLYFLQHPERTRAEIRRDYPSLAADHARRADAVITSSAYTAALLATIGVSEERIYLCPPGAPRWSSLGSAPNVPADGYLLFLGTLEPRKNVGALLDAYERFIARRVHEETGADPPYPRLVLAGRATDDAQPWLDRLQQAPLQSHVTHLGYVPHEEREQLYRGARLLIMPSLDEGFGLPALEAMSAGIPVIVSNRGSLPEVVGTAGTIVDPDDVEAFAAAIARLVDDREHACAQARAGLERAKQFTWERSVARLHEAYVDAVTRRAKR